MEVRATVAHKAGEPLSIETVELDAPRAGEVRVESEATGICHTGERTLPGADPEVIIGVAPAGAGISPRPFRLITGRLWKGTALGGARGRTDGPEIVDWYMENKINIDDLITHTMPLERINDAFDLMHEGKSIRTVVIH